MDTLPTEVISHIISYLDIRCQLQLSSVSVRWRAAVSDCLRRRRRLQTGDLGLEWPYWVAGLLRVLLPRLPALRALYLHGKDFDIDIVSQNCPRLEELDLDPFWLDTDSLERLCRRCPRLSDLYLPGGFRPELLELLLRRLPGVRALSLLETYVSATVLTLLPAGLERLSMAQCMVDLYEHQPADRWPRLTHLNLTNTHNWLAALVSGCPRLQSLDLDCEEVTEDDLVTCLGRLRQLQVLCIREVSNVTDRVLNSLAGVESLTFLMLGDMVYPTSEVQFTNEALQRLVVSSPSLRTVQLFIFEREEQMESLIAGLPNQLSPDREVTLVIDQYMMRKMNKSVLPSESRPLRVVTQ